MSHDNHVIDGINLDVEPFGSYRAALKHYLKLTEGWQPYNPDPVVKIHDGIRVVRDDLIEGTKSRGADLLMNKIKQNCVVYTQPRNGLAGISLAKTGKQHHKKVVLFMAASKKISEHQACCIERGAKPIFRRCCAMNNLACWGKEWAKKHDALFLPLGLKNKLVTAAIVDAAYNIKTVPDEVYVAISTGVLTRALQIAWPKAKFTCVAVGRNLKAGELGRAKLISEPLPFLKLEAEENLPPFPCVRGYDGKVWKYIPRNTGRNILFWSVGADPVLKDASIIEQTNSWRDWQ